MLTQIQLAGRSCNHSAKIRNDKMPLPESLFCPEGTQSHNITPSCINRYGVALLTAEMPEVPILPHKNFKSTQKIIIIRRTFKKYRFGIWGKFVHLCCRRKKTLLYVFIVSGTAPLLPVSFLSTRSLVKYVEHRK